MLGINQMEFIFILIWKCDKETKEWERETESEKKSELERTQPYDVILINNTPHRTHCEYCNIIDGYLLVHTESDTLNFDVILCCSITHQWIESSLIGWPSQQTKQPFAFHETFFFMPKLNWMSIQTRIIKQQMKSKKKKKKKK